MRQSLLETFTDIFILNLHGSSLKGEKSPDGSKDENVFDIRQGVSISIFVKMPGPIRQATVHHAELWGLRESKYIYLAERDIATTRWTTLEPKSPHYFFVPKELGGLSRYDLLPCVNEIFPLHRPGIQTKRDKFVYHITEEELSKTLEDIQQLSIPELVQKYELPPDGRDWTIMSAKRDVLDHTGSITKVAYHPFDLRWTYFTGKTKGFMAYPRYPIMGHALQRNYLLLCIRNSRRGNIDNFFVANTIVDKDSVSSFDNVTFFPLYLYPDTNNKGLFDTDETSNAPGGRLPNISPSFIADISNKLSMQFIPDGTGDLKHTFGPEDIFSYIYAVFHSLSYRTNYAEFLKIDFPRLPLTSNPELFRELCAIGDRLVKLHLMELYGEHLPNYPVDGNHKVEKVEYTQRTDNPDQGRVWINKTQYFDGVPAEVWEFKVGGYQVCHKWLKDRKGRTLSFDDIKHYQRIVGALAETILLMEQIDEVIEEHGGWPIV
jgi:predicted helicase